ncbi:polysaccharide deacetylase family protein [Rhizobium sp. CG5]|uniref:polysaccharide deacetylase family protein n=1 Tax=Rhizobium sp. CG5 TaxID=2726076 RepID=UPI00203483F8|nr:polysaccharide deacetylase family protein [Rhizobium sp. CG5]MCM2476914.1 polysaccharide deacetylase family protein [Rhizobium sp. CG5]
MDKALIKKAVISAGLEASAALCRAGLMAASRGRGAIFTLHHVRPYAERLPDPNRHLEIAPEFLDAALTQLKADGYRFVALDDIPALLKEPAGGQPFAAFTLDDGYRNNAALALPVFERHAAPFTVFVCKGFSERSHGLWWETLAELVRRAEGFDYAIDGDTRSFATRTIAEKSAAFATVAASINTTDEACAIARLNALAARHGIDDIAIVDQLVMTADELRGLAAHPLASLGAHTVSHRALGLLGDEVVLSELNESAGYVDAIAGRRPATFAYPYGDGRSVTEKTIGLAEAAGLPIAVTTTAGTLTPQHRQALSSLPRISLNGFYQKTRYVSALASGIPFRLMGRSG